ncbi:unnamed protein product [Trichobilharzia regenti]|nr:unnamed protein product [Trichobilharzia regenti]
MERLLPLVEKLVTLLVALRDLSDDDYRNHVPEYISDILKDIKESVGPNSYDLIPHCIFGTSKEFSAWISVA